MRPTLWLSAIALAAIGCAPDLPPGREQDVLQVLINDLSRMGDIVFVSGPSHCGTQGQTDAPLSAALFNALLVANHEGAKSDLAAISPTLQIDESGKPPRLLRARLNKTVMAISKAGIVGNAAVVCLEIYGSIEEQGFFLVFSRDGTGQWAIDSELPVWQEEISPFSEELPDGTPYGANGI